MGGHERRAVVAACARSRPEASPSAPRAITHGGVLAAVGGEHDIDSKRRGGGNGNGLRLQCSTGASWLRPRARTPPLLCHIERACDTTTRPRRQQRRRETIETRIAIAIDTTNTTGLPLQYRAREDHGGEQALGQPPEPHKGAGAGPGSEEPLLADGGGRWAVVRRAHDQRGLRRSRSRHCHARVMRNTGGAKGGYNSARAFVSWLLFSLAFRFWMARRAPATALISSCVVLLLSLIPFSLAVAHSPVQRARCCFVPHLFGGPWGGHQVWGVRTRIRTQNEPNPSQGEVPGGRKTTLEAQLGIPNHPLRC